MLLLGQMRQTNVSRVSDTVSRPDQSAPQLGKYMAKDYLGCHITQNGLARLWLLTAFDGPNVDSTDLFNRCGIRRSQEVASIIASLEDLYGRSGPQH